MPVIHTFKIWEIKHIYLKEKKSKQIETNSYILLVSRGKTNYFTYVLMKYATENNCEIDALKYLLQKTAKR